MFDYPVALQAQDGGGFVVTFPDIPEAVTQGEDEEEALLYAIDALETALSIYVDARKPLPIPSKPKRGQRVVHPSALESAKLAIYSEMVEQGVRKSDLARKLGWHLPQVDRLLDLTHATRMEHLESAAKVLGKELRLSVV
jgi:antitoxin HicB